MQLKTSTAIAALVAGLLIAAPALAADLDRGSSIKDGTDVPYESPTMVNWTGFYVGGQVGLGVATLGDEDGQGGISADGLIAGGRAGFDIARGRFLFGVFGEYNWSGQSLEAFGVTFAEKESDWTVGGRLGYIAAPRTLAYALVGYTQAEFSAFGGGETFDGITAGGGIEYALGNNLFTGLEATHTWYDTEQNGVSLNDSKIMIPLRLKLSSPLANFRD